MMQYRERKQESKKNILIDLEGRNLKQDTAGYENCFPIGHQRHTNPFKPHWSSTSDGESDCRRKKTKKWRNWRRRERERKEREREREREREGEILYIKNYADHFGLPQPSAPHGHNKPAPIYLPCHTTKLLLHSDYIQAGGEVSYTTFRRIWKVACPDIV